MSDLEIFDFTPEPRQTAEIIKFPVPNTDDVAPLYFVLDGEDEVCTMLNLPNARNIARLLAADWPAQVFEVVDEWNVVLFTSGSEVN
jgi:hypothetical protein